MEATVLSKVVLPIGLALVMLGMGLSLVPDDFKRVFKHPKAFLVGILCQMLLLPAVGFGIAFAMNLPAELAVGLVILSLCPGGVTSNVYTHLAKGDVALSISLTAVVSLIAPFTIPIFANIAMESLMGQGQAFALPLGKTIITLAVITVVPVGIGMLIRSKGAKFALAAAKPMKIFSVVLLAAIIVGIAKQSWAELPGFFAQVGWAALTLNVVTMALGFAAAQLFRLGRAQSVTIGLEVGLQNGTTALMITLTLLASSTMAIAPAVYSIIMFATGALFAVAVNLPKKSKTRENPDNTSPRPLPV